MALPITLYISFSLGDVFHSVHRLVDELIVARLVHARDLRLLLAVALADIACARPHASAAGTVTGGNRAGISTEAAAPQAADKVRAAHCVRVQAGARL